MRSGWGQRGGGWSRHSRAWCRPAVAGEGKSELGRRYEPSPYGADDNAKKQRVQATEKGNGESRTRIQARYG